MLDSTAKYLQGENTVAHLASLSVMKEKSFVTLTPNLPSSSYILQTQIVSGRASSRHKRRIWESKETLTVKIATVIIYSMYRLM